MKKFIQVLLLIPLLLVSFSCSSSDSIVGPDSIRDLTSVDKEVASRSGAFGLNLLNEIVKTETDSNIFISPLSISTALGMTINGAKGETYTQMKNTLQLSGNTQDEINKSFLNLNNILIIADPKVSFTDANSIWCRQGLSFEQNFLDVNRKYFNANVQSLEFKNPASVGIINNWVNDHTKGKITEIIDNIPSDMVMYLINAIYFKAEWTTKFDSLKTKAKIFRTPNGDVQCQMMNQQNKFNYFKGADYSTLEIPYGEGNFNMFIILPDDNVNINQVLSRVNNFMVNQINTGMTKQEIDLYLPRFQVSYNILLNNPLINLGMNDAFDPSLADFSNISKTLSLFVSEVIHKTYIKVGEEGTEAAAVTAVGMATGIVINPGIVFYVGHPFIFLITEKNSGAVLFAGKIVNPLN